MANSRFHFVHHGIQLRQRRVEPLDNEPTYSNPVELLEQYVALKPEWMSHPRRHCKGRTDDFFGSGDAVVICEGCPVQHECLLYALETNQRWGVWGGTTEEDRKRMMKSGIRWK